MESNKNNKNNTNKDTESIGERLGKIERERNKDIFKNNPYFKIDSDEPNTINDNPYFK